MELGKLDIYKLALKLSNNIWNVYTALSMDVKFNIGGQVVRSIDSIGANIAEGYGRFHYRDSVKFYYNARGSIWESKHWVYLLHQRKLIEHGRYERIMEDMNTLGKKLNNFMKSIKDKNGK